MKLTDLMLQKLHIALPLHLELDKRVELSAHVRPRKKKIPKSMLCVQTCGHASGNYKE